MSAKQDYPQAETLPLPLNIDPTESMRFSPQRARDITSNAIATNIWNTRSFDITIDSSKYGMKSNADPHVNSYDCTGAVSLNASMQSNVPSPFTGTGTHYMYLNMPGGQWSQNGKWMSHDLHSSHYTNLRREIRNDKKNATSWATEVIEKGMNALKNNACMHGNSSQPKPLWLQMMQSNLMQSSYACLTQINHSNHNTFCHLNATSHRMYSDKMDLSKKKDEENKEISSETNESKELVALSPRAKLKNAIKDYGSTVFIFHIAMSLVSLGIFYQLVNRYVVNGNFMKIQCIQLSGSHCICNTHFALCNNNLFGNLMSTCRCTCISYNLTYNVVLVE